MFKVKKPRFLNIVFILSSFFLLSCAWDNPRIIKKTFKKGKHTVKITEENPKDRFLSKRPLEHPHNFEEEEIFNKLLSLKYKRIALFSKEKKVFDRKLAEEITPLFVKAFNKAGRRDIIQFDVQSANGRILGDVFISRKKINWVFNTLNGASYEKGNSRDYLDSWKLVLLKGQKYHGEKELFGIRIAKNWIIYPVNKSWPVTDPFKEYQMNTPIDDEFMDSNSNEMESSDSANEPNINTNPRQEEIETQFQRLKNLMEKGLITKEEYKAKKMGLL